MKTLIAKIQIGKKGVTEGLIQSINLALKTRKQVRISALKSSGRDKEKIESMAEEIINKIDAKCSYKVIGFTIILIKEKK